MKDRIRLQTALGVFSPGGSLQEVKGGDNGSDVLWVFGWISVPIEEFDDLQAPTFLPKSGRRDAVDLL